MSLHDVMLSNDDLLAAVDLTVDFHGNEASVEEHGKVLLDVNRNHLCVQHEADLDQTEWWPTAHCMFGLQACLDNDGSRLVIKPRVVRRTTTLSGGETDLANCDWLLLMASRPTASRNTRVEWSSLDKTCTCLGSRRSSGRAAQAGDGATLWVTIDGIKYTYAEARPHGGTNTEERLGRLGRSSDGRCAVAVQNAGSRARIVRGYFPRTRPL